MPAIRFTVVSPDGRILSSTVDPDVAIEEHGQASFDGSPRILADYGHGPVEITVGEAIAESWLAEVH
jgi:hypothetical protein